MIDFDIIQEKDPELYHLIIAEYKRQSSGLEMIASENRPSEEVLLAQASYHTLKYAEGYPGHRYYGGCEVIDKTEQLAINRACELFGCKYANVQPHSGAQANLAVQFALLNPGDRLLGMSLNAGGHLTHGSKVSLSGKYFNSVQYDVDPETYEINLKEIQDLLYCYEPKLLIVGASAYPREINFGEIRLILDEYKKDTGNQCWMMVDMAHIAGLVATGLHQSPIPYADVVTSTTHKTLRGPRGGLILTNNDELIKKINKAVFPGIQGGPLENIIAAKALCFYEALQPEFKDYMTRVVENCQVLADTLQRQGVKLVTGGTDNHLLIIDLRDTKMTGLKLQERLEEVGIITNKNAIPFDTQSKNITSGLRIGTAAVTSRGLGLNQMMVIGCIIAQTIDLSDDAFELTKELTKSCIDSICERFPLY